MNIDFIKKNQINTSKVYQYYITNLLLYKLICCSNYIFYFLNCMENTTYLPWIRV